MIKYTGIWSGGWLSNEKEEECLTLPSTFIQCFGVNWSVEDIRMKCSSNFTHCNLPIYFDTYKGCGQGCKYCFARKFYDGEPVVTSSVKTLLRWFGGRRSLRTGWCDWDIPLRWGVLSDPFQKMEESLGHSLEFMKVLADYYYPYVLTTKSTLIADDKYLKLLRKSNVVVQVSASSSMMDQYEINAPSYIERIDMLPKLAKVCKRVIVRIQPYTSDMFNDVLCSLPGYKDVGVYGILIGYLRGHIEGLQDADESIVAQYEIIRRLCHKLGLHFYCNDGILSDSDTCCGCDKLKGFVVNRANLICKKSRYTDTMKQPGSAVIFQDISRSAGTYRDYKAKSFREVMMEIKKNDT